MTAAPPVRRGGALGAVLVLAAAVAVGGALRSTLAPVQEAARADLRLDDTAMSLVQGFAAAVPIALLAVPLGRVVDRGRRVRLLFWLCLVSSLGCALTAAATSFPVLFVARMLAGVGGFCGIPAAISAAADLAPAERRGRALLLITVGQYVGVAAAFAAGGALFGAFSGSGLAPWRGVHGVFAVACLLLSLPLLFLREPERREVGEAPHAELAVVLRELWARRAVLAPLFIGQAGVVMADVAATLWAAPILQRDYGLQPPQFAGWMGAVVLFTGAGGAVVGGFAADAAQRSRLPGGVVLGAAIASALAIPGALFAVAPSVPMFALLLSLLLLCGAAAGLVTAAAITVVTPNELRGVCLGAFVVLGALVGLGLAPTLVAWVGASLGGAGRLGPAMSAVALPIAVVSAIAFAIAATQVRRWTPAR